MNSQKRLFALACAVLTVAILFAQKSGQKSWSSGKVEWSDFKKKKTISTDNTEFSYFFGYEMDKERFGDTLLKRFVVKSYMDQYQSWASLELQTGQLLRYNQVLFDIVEWHRRQTQYLLDRVETIREAEDVFHEQYPNLLEAISQFQEASGEGNILQMIEEKEDEMQAQLQKKNNGNNPLFSVGKFGYGMHAGIGALGLTGPLGDHFSSGFNFQYGFDASFHKVVLFLNATIAGSQVQKSYEEDTNWLVGERPNLTFADLSLGFNVIDQRKWKIAPFVGWGIVEFSMDPEDRQQPHQRMVQSNYVMGLNIDYKIRKTLKLIPNPFFKIKEQVETNLRTRIYVRKADFYPNLNGYIINVSVGLCGLGNRIRLKE